MDRTNAERQRRYIAKLKAQAAAANGVTNGKAEAEFAKLKAEVARLTDELAGLKDELKSERGRAKMLEEGLKVAQRQMRTASQPKVAKPSLPPDEARDRRIKRSRRRTEISRQSCASWRATTAKDWRRQAA